MLRDTPVTPYTRLPVSTDLPTRNQLRDCHNLRQSMAICHFLLYSAVFCHIPLGLLNSTKFCQGSCPSPVLPRVRVDRATKLTIYTLSSHSPTFFPYVTSWLYYTVYVHSLIISTSLYIIVVCTYFVTNFNYVLSTCS